MQQQETAPVGIFPRFLAYTIDIIPITLIVFLVGYFFGGFDEILHGYFNSDGSVSRKEFLIERNKLRTVSMALWLVYSIVMEASRFQATFGKWILGYKVVDMYGERLSLLESASRNGFKLLSVSLLMFGYIMALFRTDKKTFHDLMSHTEICKGAVKLDDIPAFLPMTMDKYSRAGNPGEIKVNPWIWFQHQPLRVSVLTLALIFSIALSVFVSYGFIILVLYAGWENFYYWVHTQEKFQADSNGGIVISVEPPLVAVSTNLAKWGGDYPVIKIIEFQSKKHLKVGDRIGTIAVYQAGENDELPHWMNFFPVPINYATNDKNQIEKEIKSYANTEWLALELGIEELRKPYQEGLYKVRSSNSDWIY